MDRWGALSVKDHLDARALTAEVLLYDRLIVPEPAQGDLKYWQDNKWAPDALAQRLEQLGEDLSYRAIWSREHRADWRKNWGVFKGLVQDAQLLTQAKSEEAALFMTRMILSMRHPVSLPADGVQPEVVAVYRSRRDAHLPTPEGMNPSDAADYVVGIRLLAPDDRDPEDALRRAIDIARDSTFRQRRRAVHNWQRDKIQKWTGISPDTVDPRKIRDAILELDELVRLYNEIVQKAAHKRRVETAILTGSIAASAVALTASAVPAVFAAASIGALAGSKVVTIGGFGASTLLQMKKHRMSASEPDAAARVPAVGAMFHQVESSLAGKSRRVWPRF